MIQLRYDTATSEQLTLTGIDLSSDARFQNNACPEQSNRFNSKCSVCRYCIITVNYKVLVLREVICPSLRTA